MYLALTLLCLLAVAVIAACSRPARAMAAAVALMRTLCGLKRRTVVVDGFTWTYLDSGAARDAPTMLLIHGFGADKDTWLPYGRLLRRRFRVIAPDLPGFGESVQDAAMDYSSEAQIDRLQTIASLMEKQSRVGGIVN